MKRRRSAIPAARVLVVALLVPAVLAACSGSSGGAGATSGAAGTRTPGQTMTAPGGAGSAGRTGEITPAAVADGTLLQQQPRSVTPPAGISGLLAWDNSGYGDETTPPGSLEHQHVAGSVDYAVVPPVGGPHNPIWLNAGAYTRPVPAERAVHALEHGAVWITYRPGLPAADVAALTAFVEKQSLVEEASEPGQANRYVLLSPWPDDDLPAPVVISSWGFQLRLDSAGDPQLQAFVDTFRHSERYSPEYASPVDGVPVLTGGRPAAAGSVKPNPDGAVG